MYPDRQRWDSTWSTATHDLGVADACLAQPVGANGSESAKINYRMAATLASEAHGLFGNILCHVDKRKSLKCRVKAIVLFDRTK